MFALIAALIAIGVITMMWRYLERESTASDDERGATSRPGRPVPRRTPKSRTTAPDDDPDFLRELSKRIHQNPNDEHRPDAS